MKANQIEEELTRQIESATRKVERALLQAIEDGAKVERVTGGALICDKYIMPVPTQNKATIVLWLESKELLNAIATDAEALKKERENLQKRIAEIDEKLKSKGVEL